MSLRSVVLLLAFFFATSTAWAQEAPPSESTPPAETPPSASSGDLAKYGGVWGSEYGEVTLTITGKHVVGKYKTGTFEGDFDDNGILMYTWTDENGSEGRGTFQILATGNLGGSFGYGGSLNNGGDWTLYRK
ncbi:MAG: hypothetical protein RBU37_14015 [Myxococcota bacterium]|jgi:hypothetical protein|nr:hypothetical protein [Myxococcota bacterium]